MYFCYVHEEKELKGSPVLQLLAVDAHSSLVALGDTHLMSAAFHLLAGIFSGVHICKGERRTPIICYVVSFEIIYI